MSDFDLDALLERIERPDDDLVTSAEARLATLGRPRTGLGRIGELAAWLSAVQGGEPRALDDVRLLLLVADHGIAANDVSAWRLATQAQAARVLDGTAPVAVAAARADVPVTVYDVGLDRDVAADDTPETRIRRSSGRIDIEDAMSLDEASAAVALGVQMADDTIDSGCDLIALAALGVGSTTPAASVIGLIARVDASAVTGRGSGIDDAAWMRKCAAIRDAMRRGRPVRTERIELLAKIGGTDIGVATGVLLGAAARRTPVVIDGLVAAAAAMLGAQLAFRATDWWLCAARSAEPAHAIAIDHVGLDPLLGFSLDSGDGLAAMTAVPLLRTASALLPEAAPLP